MALIRLGCAAEMMVMAVTSDTVLEVVIVEIVVLVTVAAVAVVWEQCGIM